ncbi:MAG: hypothetical protein LBV00_10360 [Propionibacteriaceae bacterium]|jgi:predicted nucleic acid-binding protein|nr:hypothetical protein [Propionibacteriaceae bacterium]
MTAVTPPWTLLSWFGVITVTEIGYGIERLPEGTRKCGLLNVWARLAQQYSDRLLEFDIEATRAAAAILARRDRAGHRIGLAAAQIAAI